MKLIRTLFYMNKAWLALMQFVGVFCYYSSKSVLFSAFIMLACSILCCVFILILPSKNAYYLYNLGYSQTYGYALIQGINLAVFIFLASFVNLLFYA